MPDEDNVLLAAALRYAARGWRVLPLAPRGKTPLTKRGLYDASDDPDVIRGWWGQYPDANVGVRTGSISDLWVLDVDNKRSVDIGGGVLVGLGDHTIRTIEGDTGERIPDTLRARTGSGGQHYLFRWPDGLESFSNRVNLAPGLDVRADQGYIVAPPSVHPNGTRYEWVEDEAIAAVPVPEWLVRLDAHKDHEPFEEVEEVVEGGRNDYLFRYGAKLRGEGREQGEIRNLIFGANQTVCRPPLETWEVMRIVANVMKLKEPEDLPELVWDGPAEDVPALPEEGLVFVDFIDFMSSPPEPPEPIVGDGILDAGDGFILGGMSGTGKSWLAMDMALSVANGIPWLGHFDTTEGPVLYVDEEGSAYFDWSRFYKLAAGRPELDYDWKRANRNLKLAVTHGIQLDDPQGLAIIKRSLTQYQPKLIVFDTMSRSHSGDENSSQDMRKFFRIATELKNRYDTAMVFIHHVRKPSRDDAGDACDQLRGSGDIKAWADGIVAVSRKDKAAQKCSHCKSRNHAELDPFLVDTAIDDVQKVATFAYSETRMDRPHGVLDARQQVLRAVATLQGKQRVTAELIGTQVELSTPTIKEHLAVLVEGGEIDKYKIGRETYYAIPYHLMTQREMES